MWIHIVQPSTFTWLCPAAKNFSLTLYSDFWTRLFVTCSSHSGSVLHKIPHHRLRLSYLFWKMEGRVRRRQMSDRTLTPHRNQMRHKGMKSEVKKKRKRKKRRGSVEWKMILPFHKATEEAAGSDERRTGTSVKNCVYFLPWCGILRGPQKQSTQHNTTQKSRQTQCCDKQTTRVNLIKAGKSPNGAFTPSGAVVVVVNSFRCFIVLGATNCMWFQQLHFVSGLDILATGLQT